MKICEREGHDVARAQSTIPFSETAADKPRKKLKPDLITSPFQINRFFHQLLASIACLVSELDKVIAVELERPQSQSALTDTQRISNLVMEFQNVLKCNGDSLCIENSDGDGKDGADAQFLSRAIGVVEKSMSDFEFGIGAMATELAVSRRQLYRRIKAALDCTPNDFIRLLRLNRAAKLLCDSRMTVTEITHEVGFSDLKYFRRIFRKHFGMLPRDFVRRRATHLGRAKEFVSPHHKEFLIERDQRREFATASPVSPLSKMTSGLPPFRFSKNCKPLAA